MDCVRWIYGVEELSYFVLQVIRLVHGLLSRLMSIFPTEPTSSNVASKYEELECLYACVGKVHGT